jgi:hypothetical protein
MKTDFQQELDLIRKKTARSYSFIVFLFCNVRQQKYTTNSFFIITKS